MPQQTTEGPSRIEQTLDGTRSQVVVWDTEYFAPSEALGLFRDGVRTAFMPWTPDLKTTQEFSARIESSSHEIGRINRIRLTPHVTERTLADIRSSKEECIYVGFQLSGSCRVDQGGQSTTVQGGDLHLMRSDIPATMILEPGFSNQTLVLVVPRSIIAASIADERCYTNFLVPKEKIISPLSTCVSFLSEHLLSATPQELEALFEACLSLLPLATGASVDKDGMVGCSNARLFGDLIDFINRNVSNSDLTPQVAADYLGISTRYVHKLFAGCNVTFSSYVMAKRLDHIRRELSSRSCARQPIAALAYRWGFEDLSTFNRAFKNRFGCTPSQYRIRHQF